MTRLAAPPYNLNSHWTNPTYPTYCGYNLLPHWGESPPHLQPCLNHQGHGPRSVESLDSLKRHGWNLWVAKTCLRMPKFGSQTSKRKIISDRWQHCGTETWSNYSNTSNIQSSQPPQKKSGSHIEFIEWSDQIPRFLHRFWGYHHCQIPMFCWWNPPIGAKVARRCSERRWFEGAAHGGWGSGNSKFGRWKSGGKNGARVINPVRIVIYGSFVGFGWW